MARLKIFHIWPTLVPMREHMIDTDSLSNQISPVAATHQATVFSYPLHVDHLIKPIKVLLLQTVSVELKKTSECAAVCLAR